jgi:class 3 adenylate cyclase
VGATARAAELGDRAWRDLLDRHNAVVRRDWSAAVDTAGDGFLGTFDGPARAIRAACAIAERVQDLALDIRSGLHTGRWSSSKTVCAGSRYTSVHGRPHSPVPAKCS